MNNQDFAEICGKVDFAVVLVFVCLSSTSCSGGASALDVADAADAVDAVVDVAGDTAADAVSDIVSDIVSDVVSDVVVDVVDVAVDAASDVVRDIVQDTPVVDVVADVARDIVFEFPDVAMVLMPGGSFWMGCNSPTDADCGEDEFPYHQVTLSAFHMDRTETTVAAYDACVAAGSCSLPGTGDYCVFNVDVNGDNPVTCVDWQQAAAFCAWMGKRLPTEAEWEMAARGLDGRIFPWGNETPTCELAVMADVVSSEYGCGTGSAWPVCSKSPAGDSPYGLCDMAGNVWEWVSDWFAADYYVTSPATDPTGPSTGTNRVIRGGSFPWTGGYMRAANRTGLEPSIYDGDLGFRCARAE